MNECHQFTDTIAPTVIAPIIISSNNVVSSAFAATNNIVTLTFQVSEPVTTPSVRLAFTTANVVAISRTSFSASIVVNSDSEQGTVDMLVFGFFDDTGNLGAEKTNTSDGSFVHIGRCLFVGLFVCWLVCLLIGLFGC